MARESSRTKVLGIKRSGSCQKGSDSAQSLERAFREAPASRARNVDASGINTWTGCEMGDVYGF